MDRWNMARSIASMAKSDPDYRGMATMAMESGHRVALALDAENPQGHLKDLLTPGVAITARAYRARALACD
jgi:hypothetical protein